MNYIENPKTKGSGILCAIPQTGRCPNQCADCFFQSGRSYLEPLEKHLPNLPPPGMADGRVVRVNDGNDSNVDRETVLRLTAQGQYPMRFYNTAIPKLDFDAPVVLTINPGEMTNRDFHRVDPPPKNLMFVRFRANTWNAMLALTAYRYYSDQVPAVPFVMTFMAYHDRGTIPFAQRESYEWRTRTLNDYWCPKADAVAWVMRHFVRQPAEKPLRPAPLLCAGQCRWCGVCLREYFATMERMRDESLSLPAAIDQ